MNLDHKKKALSQKITSSLDDYYFDVQSLNGPNILDESHLAKLLSKMAVGIATVWWTAVELKDYIKLRKAHSQFEDTIHDFLSRKDS